MLSSFQVRLDDHSVLLVQQPSRLEVHERVERSAAGEVLGHHAKVCAAEVCREELEAHHMSALFDLQLQNHVTRFCSQRPIHPASFSLRFAACFDPCDQLLYLRVSFILRRSLSPVLSHSFGPLCNLFPVLFDQNCVILCLTEASL